MKGFYTFERYTCHAIYKLKAEVELTPADCSSVIINNKKSLEDWARYDSQIQEGVQEALEIVGNDKKCRIVVNTQDVSGDTPPLGYKQSVKGAILNAFGIDLAGIGNVGALALH